MTSQDYTMSYSGHVDDMDSYFDFNQGDYHSPVPDPKSPSMKLSPRSHTIDPLNTILSQDQHADERPVFNGPSHEYGRFRQQTGLPSGAISSVSALNDFNHNMIGSNEFAMGFNSGLNMDVDFANSPTTGLPPYFYPGDRMDDFVDPGALAPQQPPQNANRLRPGMHSQQAEQAKAEALAKQQRQQQLGQQIMEQRQREQQSSSGSSQAFGRRSNAGADPAVEERISQLLEQMRHNSTGSVDDVTSPTENDTHPHASRSRKDEEDMDEDERLLASEEGKKLTSKERRQLRNKVSARAFRSRRKEYIGQLEGEVAAKVNECNELRMKNRTLMDQNAQLTQLTQTLLRHPAFSTFLDDMSNDPSILAPPQQQQQEQTSMPQPQSQQPKDVDPYQVSKQESQQNDSVQIGMSMVPENHLNFSMLNLGGRQWPAGPFQYQQPQVFSVFEIPEGPSILDLSIKALAGKSSEPDESEYAPEWTPKSLLPSLNDVSFQATDVVQEYPTHGIDESSIKDDPSFALYVNSPNISTTSSSCTLKEAARLLENSLSGKAPVHHPMVVTRSSNGPPSFRSIDRLFAAEKSTVDRVRAMTHDLPEI